MLQSSNYRLMCILFSCGQVVGEVTPRNQIGNTLWTIIVCIFTNVHIDFHNSDVLSQSDSWLNCKLVQPLQNMVWKFQKISAPTLQNYVAEKFP